MKKELICCDSCEKSLTRGGIRMQTGNDRETVDLCPDCVAKVLRDYAERTGTSFLAVQISREDYEILMAEGAEEGPEDLGLA